MANLIYSTGRPYGAPLAMLRGGATRDPEVKDAIKAAGFHWDGVRYSWATYLYDGEFAAVLTDLAARFPEVTIRPKDGQEDLL